MSSHTQSRYTKLPPPPELRTQLRCSWRYRQGAASAPVRVLPDGCVDLIWDGACLFVAGPDHAATMACVDAGNVLTGVRLTAGAAAGVLGLPLHHIADQRVALDALWGRGAGDWQQKLCDGADVVQTLHALCRQHAAPVDRQMAFTFAQLAGAAAPRLAALCASLGISERQLRRRCHAAFGYGPKTLERILRLQRFLRLAASQPHADRRCAGGRVWRCAASGARCAPARRFESARAGAAARAVMAVFAKPPGRCAGHAVQPPTARTSPCNTAHSITVSTIWNLP